MSPHVSLPLPRLRAERGDPEPGKGGDARRSSPAWPVTGRTVRIMQQDAYMPISDDVWNDLIGMTPGEMKNRRSVGDPMG